MINKLKILKHILVSLDWYYLMLGGGVFPPLPWTTDSGAHKCHIPLVEVLTYSSVVTH